MRETPEEYAERKAREQEEWEERERERDYNAAAKDRLISRAESVARTTDWKAGSAEMAALMVEWKQIGSAGRDRNDELWSEFQEARQDFFDARTEYFEQQDRIREHNASAKKVLVSKAQSLARSTDWKATGESMNDLMADWKAIGSAGRDRDPELWDDFQVARQAFFDARKRYFEQQERIRERNAAAKKVLVAKAQSLSRSMDWKATGEVMADLMAEWKGIGSAGRDHDPELWDDFQEARQAFFDARKRYFEQQEQIRERNAAAKKALVAKAQSLSRSTDWKTTGEMIAGLVANWKTIGPAGKDHDQELWDTFQDAKQTFFDARTRHFEKRNAEIERNVDAMRRLISRANELTRWSDGRAAKKAFSELAGERKKLGSLGRETQALNDEFSAISEAIFGGGISGGDPKNFAQRISKQLDRDMARANKSAVASVFGGFAPTYPRKDGKIERHHSDPKFLGGNPNQKLTPMNRTDHRAFHRDESAFRRTYDQTGPSTRDANLNRLADQYELVKSKYPDAHRDFFEQHPDRKEGAQERVSKRDDLIRSIKPKGD